MTHLDLGLAARLVCAVRSETAQRHGCREWDAAGVFNALRATDGEPSMVISAAVIAAGNPRQDKPSPAGFRLHWHSKAESDPPPPRPVVCPTHRIQHNPADRCPSCAADEKAYAAEHEPPTGPMLTATPPPDLSALKQHLRDVRTEQRSAVEAERMGAPR